jgi:hypothetical protein
MSENGMDRKWSAYSHDGNDPNGRGAKVVGSPRERHRWNRGQKAAFASGFSGRRQGAGGQTQPAAGGSRGPKMRGFANGAVDPTSATWSATG